MDAIRATISRPVLALACMCVSSVISLTALAETKTTAPYVTIVTEVSQEFRNEVELAWRSIPRAIRADLIDQGWQLRAAKFVVQAEPSLIDQQPRGWPRDYTWWHTEAAHLPHKRLLIVAEKLVSPHGEVIKTDRAGRVLCHEIGHAYDRALTSGKGWESSSRTFVLCYARDVGRLSIEEKQELDYYTQSGSAGRQEAFAEAFAQVVSGTGQTASDRRFAEAFPSVVNYLNRKIEAPAPTRVATQSQPTTR